MKQNPPPPALGKLSPKTSKKIDKFGEWQIMKQEVDAFEQDALITLKHAGYTRIRVFAVGNPRNFQLVVTAHRKAAKWFKRIRMDVREASHQHWWGRFNEHEWELQNHVLDDGD